MTIRFVRGAVVHAPERGSLELFADAFLSINATTGRIETFHRETQPQDVLLMQQASADGEALILGKHQFFMPGFVDTHVHAPQYPFMGTGTDTPLMQWLTKYTFPVEQAFADLAFARTWYTKLLDRMLAEGITTAQYFATIHVDATKLLADLVEARGQRGFVGLVSMDRNAPETYVSSSTQQALDDAKRFVEYTLSKRNELVQPVLTPRFIPTCSLELLRGLGDLAAQYEYDGGLHIQSHAAESLDEEAFVESLHPGQRDTEILNDAKLLTKRACMAHCVHLTDDELSVFKATGTSIAHCPLSNFFFANGFLNLQKALDRGVAVGLGTDVAGGYSPSMLRAIQTCVLTTKALEIQNTAQSGQQRQFDYKDAFWVATMGGAAA
ncbi:Guanine deaminase, partial [Globisporangium polare]